MCRLRRVSDDRFLLQGSQRKSSPPLDVFKLLFDEFKAFVLLDDEAAILAMAAAAAANILLLLLLAFDELPLAVAELFCMRAEAEALPVLALQLPEE